jgi:hypothetical protein
MQQLMRRVAMSLTLPLAVGAPMVLVAGPAHAVGMTITAVTATPTSVVYGQSVTATATVTVDGSGDPVGAAGAVQFLVRHSPGQAEFSESGAPVPLNAAGVAVSAALVQPDGKPLDLTEGVSDFWQVQAQFEPAASQPYDMSIGDSPNPVSVSMAGTSIAVLPTATTLVADVTGVLPGGTQANSVRPGGAVEFKVNGAVVGSNDLVNGRATLDHVLPSGSQSVTATYAGDPTGRYGPATQTSTRRDPILETRVLSMLPKAKSGWYHTAVDLWFICKPQGSELVEECPADFSLKESGRGQSVTRTVHAVDGGSATVTISGIDIDRDRPVITVKGHRCTATDKLSGLKGKCHMKIAKNRHYRAIAIDRAGNRAVKRGILD